MRISSWCVVFLWFAVKFEGGVEFVEVEILRSLWGAARDSTRIRTYTMA